MAGKNGFTANQVLKAVDGSGGLVTTIAKRLGCSRMTVYRYRDKYATVATAIQEEREGLLDMAESELLKQIRGGNMTAIIFFLKTQGKKRGYVERSELTGADGKDLVTVNWDDGHVPD